ncbi:hypothetical protein Flexsi_0040 [Flexistipes sinusarabici DSM 4947]|uniref:DUF2680 domain-containing protein n=1 Tax=Flexistipes sinusarabici (strain ATCC 49648 / DSM 4947 / MAS 10) TaxID=717231 RepID=F8E6V2_FLESM|nr:hypothetical protein [Flexistipes sinusarabici]AEI13738.1 hypothetical protein Flexsi_0040 [Flexistipes sinusarabici DSM 4947]
MNKITITAAFLLSIVLNTFVSAAEVKMDELISNTPAELQNQVRQAAAESREVAETLQNMYQHGYSKSTVSNFLNKVEEYQQRGYPVSDLTDKVNEGIAKNVRGQMITHALNQMAQRQEFASKFAAQFASKKSVRQQIEENVKEAMAAGMKKDDIQAVGSMLNQNMQQNRNISQMAKEVTETAKTMSRLGVQSSQINGVLNQAMQHNFTHQEMSQMRQSFRENFSSTHAGRFTENVSKSIGAGYRGASAVGHADGMNDSRGGMSGSGQQGTGGMSDGGGMGGHGEGSGSGGNGGGGGHR